MRIDVVSIFCEYLDALNLSLIGKAQDKGIVEIVSHDLRDFTHDKHRTVDDTPYGGGAGMVMRPEPWGEALQHVRQFTPQTPPTTVDGQGPETDELPKAAPGPGAQKPVLVIPSPAGQKFSQPLAAQLATRDHLVFACGRYEGIDERVFEASQEHFDVLPVSLGDYVLNGGEVAVLAMTEAIVRLIPGVVGNPKSLVEESHSEPLLEYPVYTKPASWQGLDVPSVLLGGDHQAIADWRLLQQQQRTAERRPDLLPTHDGDLSVRLAVPADAGQLWTLGLAVASTKETWPAAIPQDVGEWQALIASGQLFVAVDAGRVIGVATLGSCSDPGGTDSAEVDCVTGVMVVPDRQGGGVASSMVDALRTGRSGLALLVPNSRKDLHKLARRRKWRRRAVDGGIRYSLS